MACAASPAGNPNVIYAGGQNNGVSSGVIKTIDGGKHWTRTSKGLWDTRILGVWVHPDDAQGKHVLAGTHSGIYESTDGAASWTFRNETTGWGNVMSFREGVIQGRPDAHPHPHPPPSPSPSPSSSTPTLAPTTLGSAHPVSLLAGLTCWPTPRTASSPGLAR